MSRRDELVTEAETLARALGRTVDHSSLSRAKLEALVESLRAEAPVAPVAETPPDAPAEPAPVAAPDAEQERAERIAREREAIAEEERREREAKERSVAARARGLPLPPKWSPPEGADEATAKRLGDEARLEYARERAARSAPKVDGNAKPVQGGAPAPEQKLPVPRGPYYVAPGRSIVHEARVYGPLSTLRTRDFPDELLAALVARGLVVKA